MRAHMGVQSCGQRVDPSEEANPGEGAAHLVICGVAAGEQEVLPQRGIENVRPLLDQADGPTCVVPGTV